VSAVLLGQGYSLRLDPKLQAAQQPYAPLGTLYAAAFLRTRGFDVALHDAMISSSSAEWEAALDRHRPRLAVLYEDGFNYLTKMCLSRAREAAVEMIGAARRRGCAVVVSGSDASDHPAPYLAAGAQAVIVGEGEVTLAETAAALHDERPSLDAVPGLIVAGDGAPRRTIPRPAVRDLDALPRPAWDLVDVAAYRRIWTARHGYFSMNAVTTRGCPYHCNWCAKPIYGQRYAAHSAASAASELAWLKRTYAPDHVSFFDDIFGLKPGWVVEFAEHVEAEGAAVPFKCLSRADLLGDDVVRALRRAGCRTVWIGAESGSQKILDAMEKGTTVEQIRQAAARLRAHGIEVGFFLQFGYPGEGLAEIRQTLALVRDCEPDDIGVSVAYPLPGTRFFDKVRDQLGAKRNWTDSDDLAMMYDGPFSTEFYRTLHRVVHKELRLQRRDARAGTPARRWRRVASRLLAATTLPLEHWKLGRLARRAHPGAPTLSPPMARERAATPTPLPMAAESE
jgi:anaerobic magnesium-protoporphyrin IX monomethyl ester cyclase